MKRIFSSNIKKAYLFRFLIHFHLIGGVLVPFFTDWGGLTLTHTLFIQSWYLVWAFLLEIPTGAVADYIGRRQSLYLAGLVGTIAVLTYSSVASLPIFLLAEFLFAVSFALFSGADEAFLYDSLKADGKEKSIKKVMGRYQSFGLAALMISAPLGSFIGQSIGPRFSMMFMAIPIFLAFLVGLTLKEPPKEESHESTRYIDIVKEGLKVIKNRRKIQWIALDVAVVHSLTFIMIWLYQPLLSSLGVSIGWFGVVHAANSGIQILIMNNYHKLEKKFSINKLLGFTAVIPGLLFILAGSTKLLPLVIFSIIFILGFGLTRRPLVAEELNQMIPSAQRATILSTLQILRKVFSAGLNPIVGKLADWSLNSTLIILGITLLIFSGFRKLVLAKYKSN